MLGSRVWDLAFAVAKTILTERVLGSDMGVLSHIILVSPNIETPTFYHMGGCQNYGSFLGPYYIMALGGLVLGFLIIYLKGMRIMMLQLSGYYYRPSSSRRSVQISR